MLRNLPTRAALAILVIPFLTAGDSLPLDQLSRTDLSSQASSSARPAVPEDQIYNTNGSFPTVTSSLIHGGLSAESTDGGGNLGADPILLDSDGADNIPGSVDDEVSPQTTSPVVNAGDNSLLPPDLFDLDDDGDTEEPMPTDFLGANRSHDSGGGISVTDMGAFETDAIPSANDPDVTPHESSLSFETPFPNPIELRGELEFTLPRTEHVEITIFDVVGRRRAIVFQDLATKDREYHVDIDASGFGSGVYFARLRSASFDKVNQFVVVQ